MQKDALSIASEKVISPFRNLPNKTIRFLSIQKFSNAGGTSRGPCGPIDPNPNNHLQFQNQMVEAPKPRKLLSYGKPQK
jgi:hypothetical protein